MKQIVDGYPHFLVLGLNSYRHHRCSFCPTKFCGQPTVGTHGGYRESFNGWDLLQIVQIM